ncbi:MAG: metallophosphatase [Bacteroidaceae bacterium]|nr:metallophosphatase [Bacteroidaceae bacterium]
MKKYIAIISVALLFLACMPKSDMLTILHTNDTHSCILAEKDGGAGVLNRALLIEHLADSLGRDNILLFDCGDFSQGSLFYNVFKGEIEIGMMNAMGYDACAIGNHEFDFGIENMARLFSLADFHVLCANYDFTGTVCEGLVKPYAIIEKGGRKIGVFALSPNPKGLVAKENYEGVEFISPLDAVNNVVPVLKSEGCDAIICLSHLGWQLAGDYNDEILATSTSGIDVILGGHSHDYFSQPLSYMNADGDFVLVQQMGKNGRYLGWVNMIFN